MTGLLGKLRRIRIACEADIYAAAQRAKRLAQTLCFDEVARTRLGTIALELARNALIHGGGGCMHLCGLYEAGRIGLEIEMSDDGPGIGDMERALADGYSTAGGLGQGLGAVRRLSDEFEIASRPGGGTRVRTRVWRETADESEYRSIIDRFYDRYPLR
jgi:serine/threonine-protein kinase RsbT